MVRKYLFAKGYRYRKNDKRYPGKPDIVIPKIKTIVFIHGCFWHGHEGCKHADLPASNVEYWKEKIDRNVERDSRNVKELQALGWDVITTWTCQLSTASKRTETLENLLENLNQKLHRLPA